MKKRDWVDSILDSVTLTPSNHPPRLSVVIPTDHSGERIGQTLDSLFSQQYPDLEVIIVDAGSTDHTLPIVRSYKEKISRLYSIANRSHAHMLNRGITLCTGRYVTFLYPGASYLTRYALSWVASVIESENAPDLIYSGLIRRELFKEPTTLFGEVTAQNIKEGLFATSLPACFFRTDLFETIGKFDPSYQVRMGFELIARLVLHSNIRLVHLPRILLDVDLGPLSYGRAFLFTWETLRILSSHFGMQTALSWAWHIDQSALFSVVWHRLKQHLFRT